ncbi:MAG TPA: acyltransferase [Gammaproteobacteria bacterium]|nr:acyltransferase [Gammaproteobacteria bacterium]|tara:strand:- start:3860 stop:4696 length:837 start_codon:yes stop_codon:yes gene_type:complete
MVHIVDTLIEERATKLMRHPRIWHAVQRYLYPIFGYDAAVRLIDSVQDLTGTEIFELLCQRLQMQIDIQGIEHIPKEGGAVLMPNHPAGIADGVAVYDALSKHRPDLCFFANRDAIRCANGLTERIIPVEWAEERRNHAKSKETVRSMSRAFKDQRLIVIFPSGRLAQPTIRGLIERPWLASGVALAQRYQCPIVPMHISTHNSVLYYFLWFLNTELKDMTLFRELLNKKNQPYRMTVGQSVSADIVGAIEAESLAEQLRDFVSNQLPRGQLAFNPAR